MRLLNDMEMDQVAGGLTDGSLDGNGSGGGSGDPGGDIIINGGSGGGLGVPGVIIPVGGDGTGGSPVGGGGDGSAMVDIVKWVLDHLASESDHSKQEEAIKSEFHPEDCKSYQHHTASTADKLLGTDHDWTTYVMKDGRVFFDTDGNGKPDVYMQQINGQWWYNDGAWHMR